MFTPLDPQPNFANLEEETLKRWREKNVFQESLTQTKEGKPFVFYDGPPTANARPALHHTLPSAFKDAICRYQAMAGRYVQRQPGWDTHGLPVEVQVEKALGLSGKQQILNIVPGDERASIAKFNEVCRTSVWEFKQDWDVFIERTGRWMDMEHPYITYDASYIEGVWSVLKQIWDKNLVFKDYKVVAHCPRCDTGLSAAEVAMEYQDVKDVSVYVTFPLTANPKRSFIAWTTTPWTLPGNVALALGKDIVYAVVSQDDHEYILAKDRLEVLTGDYTILEEKRGSELVDLEYAPLFPGVMDGADGRRFITVLADFVTTTDGSGIVHTACMYGEDDFVLGKQAGLTMKHSVNTYGHFLPHVTEFAGLYIKDALVPILKSLTEKGRLYKKQTITHSYPHCWRCKTPLIYFAKDSWYIGMSRLRSDLVAANQKVHWVPEHVRDGRFGDFIAEARDWAISRERFWGTPLPIWKNAAGDFYCVGSVDELRTLAKSPLPADFDPHRPYIDDVVLVIDGQEYHREPYVLDVWFDSGAMPFASGRVAAGDFPADFIAEAVDQTRGWFNSLMAIGVILRGESPYKNVICMGHLVDEHGKKMSKSIGNVIVPADAFAVCGVDAVRWFIFAVNSPGENKPFGFKELQTSFRKALLPLWNVANYFITYANLEAYAGDAGEKSELDRWILSRLEVTRQVVTAHFEAYDLMRATRALEDFVQELSTWYLRRSRKRTDVGFFATMEQVLTTTCRLIAPIAPFIAEEIYQAIVPNATSVHLAGWPEAHPENLDQAIEADMASARRIVELGLAARAEAKIKVRQPLRGIRTSAESLSAQLSTMILEELNISEIQYAAEEEMWLDPTITPELQELGEARDLLRLLQNLRKETGLNPGQVVALRFGADHADYLRPMFEKFPVLLESGFFTIDNQTWETMGETELDLNGRTLAVSFEV